LIYVFFTESIANSVEPNEFDTYLGPGNAQCNKENINQTFSSFPLFPGFSSEYDNNLALMDNLPAQPIGK
jgi:hypothetical protein